MEPKVFCRPDSGEPEISLVVRGGRAIQSRLKIQDSFGGSVILTFGDDIDKSVGGNTCALAPETLNCQHIT